MEAELSSESLISAYKSIHSIGPKVHNLINRDHWLRVVLSKWSNWVGVSSPLHLRTATYKVSETSCFYSQKNTGWWKKSKNPVILRDSLKPHILFFFSVADYLFCSSYSSALKMEASYSSETSVDFQGDYTVLYPRRCFPQSLQTNARNVPQLGHDHFQVLNTS
jgi:hypothetical protein